MPNDLTILMLEAMAVYLLVLLAHSLRGRAGLAYFYALIGGITAVMSWVTDAGVTVQVGGITFMVGSTVFYTALLLGVFVVYVFDGPRAARIAIGTVAGVSIMVPLIALVLHVQMQLSGHPRLAYVPMPGLRINAASVVATVADLVFLAMAWEFLGQSRVGLWLWLRSFLTLLGVMWLDVLLFGLGAFAGTPGCLSIMTGTLVTRFIIAVFASPLLYLYLHWQNRRVGLPIENRPVLAILREMLEVRAELSLAQQEIERRKQAEAEKARLIAELEDTLARVRRLEGLLPVCAGCKRIRVGPEPGTATPAHWVSLEDYLVQEQAVQFTHGLCAECIRRLYPDIASQVNDDAPPAASAPPATSA